MSRRLTTLALAAAAIIGAAAILLATGSPADAAPGARPVRGHLTSQVLTGPACTSPIDLCTAGRLTGGVQGDFVFAATRTAPSDVPGVLLYTGTLVVRTRHGDLSCVNAGAFNTAGDGEVVDLCEIIGGTGRYAGATGYLRVFGTFTPAEGGNSDYTGVLRLP